MGTSLVLNDRSFHLFHFFGCFVSVQRNEDTCNVAMWFTLVVQLLARLEVTDCDLLLMKRCRFHRHRIHSNVSS